MIQAAYNGEEVLATRGGGHGKAETGAREDGPTSNASQAPRHASRSRSKIYHASSRVPQSPGMLPPPRKRREAVS